MRQILFSVIIIFLFVTPAFGFKIVTKEIKFKDDPVLIKSSWAHIKEEEYSKELYCWVEHTNQSAKTIEAVGFRMLFYDIFNDYLDTVSGVSTEKFLQGETMRSGWKPNIYKDWATGTVIIFLDKIRFEDGTIWKRDEVDITKELSELKEFLFKPEQLALLLISNQGRISYCLCILQSHLARRKPAILFYCFYNRLKVLIGRFVFNAHTGNRERLEGVCLFYECPCVFDYCFSRTGL